MLRGPYYAYCDLTGGLLYNSVLSLLLYTMYTLLRSDETDCYYDYDYGNLNWMIKGTHPKRNSLLSGGKGESGECVFSASDDDASSCGRGRVAHDDGMEKIETLKMRLTESGSIGLKDCLLAMMKLSRLAGRHFPSYCATASVPQFSSHFSERISTFVLTERVVQYYSW
jgi:hypothetical protein